VGWHGVEAAIAVGAGLVAGSIALIGFEADDDETLTFHTDVLYEGLYAYLSREVL
jgi:hypothetical protein